MKSYQDWRDDQLQSEYSEKAQREHERVMAEIEAEKLHISRNDERRIEAANELLDRHRTFEDKSFKGMDLSGRDLSGRTFTRCPFTSSNLTGVSFKGATLIACHFGFTHTEAGSPVDFTGATILRCKLESATLIGAKFTGSRLETVDCKFATLTDADFSGALLNGVEFNQADLEGATWDKANGENIRMNGTEGLPKHGVFKRYSHGPYERHRLIGGHQ